MKTEEFISQGLLKKSKATKHEIEGSLTIAQHFRERAEGNLNMEYYDVAFSLAYQSMFHSARALLFRNELKERSHIALISALKEIYANDKELLKLLDTLNSYRLARHAIQYTGAACNEGDAKEAIKDAEKFIDKADLIISGK